MDRVLVTGGTGFVGYWMQKTQPMGITGAYLNRIRYENEWDSIDTVPVYDGVVHLAPISPAPACEYVKRNHMTRLLYCSSGIIYHPENNTEYRRNKVKWEQECLDSGVDVVIARLFTFCGERLDDNKAIVRFEAASRTGEPLRIWGDGSCVRSYMHGSELGKWMWAILLHGQSGVAYDVGSDEPVTMLELARRFSDNIVIENTRPDPMPVYLPPDTAKTKRLLDIF